MFDGAKQRPIGYAAKVLLAEGSRTPFLCSCDHLSRQQRQLPQQIARRDRFPRQVLGKCQANEIAGSGYIVQQPNDVVGCVMRPVAHRPENPLVRPGC